MRAEEKELEGPDLEREQTREDMREAASKEEELPDLTIDVKDVELDHRSRLFDALRLILAREQVNIALLYLPQRETHALEALHAAVNGSDSMGEFVFAEDRRALLEQSLAILQQNLTHGEPEQLAELQSKFDSLTQQVGELRERLTNLEDAQEEIDEWHNAAREKRAADDAAGDKDDDATPAPQPDSLVDVIAEAIPSTLSHGPERKEAPKPPTTLVGPGIDIQPKPRSTLYDDSGGPPDATATSTHDPAPQLRKILPKPDPEPPKGGKP